MTDIELKDLCGEHVLTGVDMSIDSITEDDGEGFEDCNVINFTLDGTTYTACENPDDGYRSNMRYLRVSDKPTSNTFAPVKVVGRMKPDGRHGDVDDVLELLDSKTGRLVIEVGTEDPNDYYPQWVANFSPENMACNHD